jgi:hypothetical protein
MWASRLRRNVTAIDVTGLSVLLVCCGTQTGGDTAPECPGRGEAITYAVFPGTCGGAIGSAGDVTIVRQASACSFEIQGAASLGLPTYGKINPGFEGGVTRGGWSTGDCKATSTDSGLALSCMTRTCDSAQNGDPINCTSKFCDVALRAR